MRKEYKKKIIKLITVIAVPALLLSACGKKSDEAAQSDTAPGESANTTETSQQVENNQPDIDLKTAVKDMYSFDGVLGVEEYEQVEVSYHIPLIDLDLPGAKDINKQIEADFDDIINMTDIDKEYPTWYEVSWDATLNDEILSLIVTRKSCYDDWQEKNAYNLNVSDGSQLSNADLLKAIDITEDEYITRLRKAAAYEADQQMYYFFGSEYMTNSDVDDLEKLRMYREFLSLRMDTVSNDNIHLESQMYLNKSGELTTETKIAVLAGSGFYNTELLLAEENKAKNFQISYKNAMFIDYSNGDMTIRIEKNDWSSGMFGDTEIEFGKTYPIHGVFKDYIEGDIVVDGNDDYGYPAFLAADGLVSFLQPYECAAGLYFCINEPVYGVKDVKTIVNNPEAHDAVRGCLNIALPEFVPNMMGLYFGDGVTYETQHNTQTGSYVSDYYMGFNMENPWEFLYQDSVYAADIYQCYSGSCSYVGMDETGAVYGFYLENTEDSTDKKQGLFRFKRCYNWESETEEGQEWVDYTCLGGTPLFGAKNETIALSICQG